MSGKRIKLSGAAYQKLAKEKKKNNEELLQKIPKLHSFFPARIVENSELISTEEYSQSQTDISKIEIPFNTADDTKVTEIITQPHSLQNFSFKSYQTEITVYDCNDKSQIPGPDPVKWNLNLDSINFLLANPPKIDISTIPFAETKRMFGNISRRLTPEHFMRKLQNGEKKLREWVLYSPSKNALFCFQCLLFSPKPTVFGNKNEGFINWKKCNECLQEHETTSRGLAFRGNSHNFGSKQNGNYLGCLELVAKFDPFLSAHIANYGNKGNGNVSYLSSNICDEFITLMSNTVIDKIVSEIKERKYFSLIVDSTPDVTTRDQLTVAIRYISNEGLLVERFLGFIPSVGHKGSDMEQALLKKFCELNIDLKYCRGQSYDNASNMSGIYNGLQTRIKNYSSTAFFVPCSAHSLNLIGSNAADTT
ncbi:zinc finger MYM-type protein 1-like [Rhopalosiphum padi]|uniref:zinc finger MYM-type protein 1-like n=1 Tax=Rhopalosiphum padi TaxID=40932 RepID=UPI00298D7EB9|nr:zinc finger MYM-type protein 1-like [Rhopalosiphum padi]